MSTAQALKTSRSTSEPASGRRRPTKRELFARRQLIARLREEGLTNLEIAERLGWGNQDTRVGGEVHRMRELGWHIESRAHTGREEMARRKEAAAVFWEADLERADIAHLLEISDSACDSMLFRMRAAGEIEPHRPTPEKDGPIQAEIAAMAARGDTYQEIADQMLKTPSGVSSTIYRIRRRVAPYLKPTAEVPPRFVPGEAQRRHAEVWRLACAGVSREAIAAQCDYEPATVTCILSEERMRRREEGEPESALVLARPSEAKIKARHREVWRLARSGLSREEIAERCGYGPKWVEKIVHEERERRRAAGESASDLTLPRFSPHTEAQARHVEVWAMAAHGVSREEIAGRTGYALSTVKGIISRELSRRREAGQPEAELELPLPPGAIRVTPPGFWTEEKSKQLIGLYNAKNGPTAIAKIMGLRFNQVSSRLTVLQEEGRIVRVGPAPSRERIKALHEDYLQSGLSLSRWCAQENLSRPVMSRRFRKLGLPIRRVYGPRLWTEEKTEELIALHEAGNRARAIAELMGLGRTQVNNRLSVLVAEGKIGRTRTIGEVS